ncbi:MAG: hypothetical protein ABI835_17905 [Chloroflexota bacterium]
MLKSKKVKILTSVGALVLVVVVSGFALSRGYLIRFNVNDQPISRDAFYANAFAAPESQIPMHCAQVHPALGLLYVYEVNCFATQDAVSTYMEMRYPQ